MTGRRPSPVREALLVLLVVVSATRLDANLALVNATSPGLGDSAHRDAVKGAGRGNESHPALAPAPAPAAVVPVPTEHGEVLVGHGHAPPVDLERRLQRLQEQRRLCARCDCFALRRGAASNATVRVSLDENLNDVAAAAATTAPTTPVPPERQVLVINCTSRLLAEELPRWSWPARLSMGEPVAAEIWTEFRGGDLSGVARLPHLPFRLTRLSLADNRLRSVAPSAFANLGELRDLDLSHNVIADVPHDAFLGLASLRRLNLSRNSLSSRPLSADLFKELGKLTRVSLAHNKLAGDLNGDTLPWSGSIQELDLSFNELVGVSGGAWRRLAGIKILDLSHNKLKSLTPDAFAELRSLERLDLSWNALALLASGALAGMVALRSLDLSHNGLGAVPGPAFAPLSALTSLDLSWNALGPDSLAALGGLPPSLRDLDLSHNPLGRSSRVETMEGGGEAGAALPPSLEALSLERCGLQGLDVRAWGGLRSLRRLQLSGNDISALTDVAHLDELRDLNASRNSLTRFPTVSLPALRSLDLSHNQLERAPSAIAPHLAVLVLDNNPMEELRVAASPALALLSAQHMPLLRALPRGAVSISPVDGANLTAAPCLSLLLGRNLVLDSVNEDALALPGPGVQLCQLDLSHNALRWLPPRMANWSSVRVLDLQGNPWTCSCRLQWMLDSVVRQLYLSSPELLDDLRCAGPAAAAGRRLVHWFNHTGPSGSSGSSGQAGALCNGELMDLQAAGTVTFKMPLSTLAVVVAAGLVAIVLVVVGITVHRKHLTKRRARNRRL